eukprot:1274081-Amphidinium_carterae.1
MRYKLLGSESSQHVGWPAGTMFVKVSLRLFSTQRINTWQEQLSLLGDNTCQSFGCRNAANNS